MTRSLLALSVLAALCLPTRGASPAVGSAAADVLTPHRVAELRAVSAAEISPDGRWVAYTLSVPRNPLEEEDGPSRSQLHLLDRESGVSRPFVTSSDGVSGVTWTPDSSALLFLAKRGDDKFTALYRLAVDGGEALRLLALEKRSISSFRLAANGHQVAVLSADSESEAREKEKKQGFQQEIYEEDLHFTRVFVASLGESADAPTQLPLDGHVYAAEWSPDCTKLAVSMAPTALVDDQYMRQRVYVVDASSGAVKTLVDNPGKLGEVSWSPDSKQLAVIAGADLHDGSPARLLLANAENGRLRDRLPGHPGDFEHAHWTTNGIFLLGSRGVWSTFAKLDPAGGEPQLLLPLEGPILTAMSLSEDGKQVAFVADTPMHPAELFTVSLPGGSLERRSDSNPWLKDVRLAQQDVVVYQARDGQEIEGVLVRPLDEKPGQRYPLILCVHGGPESHYANGWQTAYSRPGQVAAAQGMATFYQNYRGSTGRGLEFLKLSQGDPAGKEFDDVIDGIGALVQSGLVDEKKVGVTGGSYGGYATAWCSTYYSDRIAAGVMFVGISDKISKVGTTDIPGEEFCVHALKRPWDDWDFFLKRSPIYYADRCKTPLLILHGKDDPRVDPGQSREMYRHLKLRGKAPVRLVHYPGEGHGNRKAAARLDYNLRMMRWFTYYLQGPGGEAPAYDLDHTDPTAVVSEATPAGG